MKTFDNPKDALDYMRDKAKEGERICLDERATMTHSRRVRYFKKENKK